MDTSIPIGLITNELITNSLKYAFLETGCGKFSIAINRVENNIIQLLTTQLGGEIKNRPNAELQLSFNLLFIIMLLHNSKKPINE